MLLDGEGFQASALDQWGVPKLPHAWGWQAVCSQRALEGPRSTGLWSEPCLLPLEVSAHCLVWGQCWASGFHGPLSPALGDATEIQMNAEALLKQAITWSGDGCRAGPAGGWPGVGREQRG